MRDRKEIAAMRRMLVINNRKYTKDFVPIPKQDWPYFPMERGVRVALYRSRDFIVQVFEEAPGYRLSINRAAINSDGTWKDGITWDELFWIKNAVGYRYYDAVEIYPNEGDLVNVSNIRHLWVFKELLPFGWRKTP